MTKAKRKSKLQERLPVRAKQIGIIDCEIPYMTFDGAEFRRLENEARVRLGLRQTRAGGKYTTMGGYCSFFARLIFIKVRNDSKLRDLEDTMIHELVHYRWHWKSHGRDFEKRITEIKKGKSFERKHIVYPQWKSFY